MPTEASDTTYDFVIIGSGLGGLLSGYLLASEGYRVIILEKNHQIGGMLQVFSRDKAILDTGVHYVGSMNNGQTVSQIFKYIGIFESLKYHPLDGHRFDEIRFQDGATYAYGQGYDQFATQLKEAFPEEEEAIDTYCQKIQETCSYFPLYSLQSEEPAYLQNEAILSELAEDVIKTLTTNTRLQNVLAANNSFLYAGDRTSTPFYVHALIMNSYLNGAVRFTDGGSQIAIQISKKIRECGGVIKRRAEVIEANYSADGQIKSIILKDGSVIKGKQFISNIHPEATISLFGESHFSGPYKRRVKKAQNSISCFATHLVFKPNSFAYRNKNIYYYGTDDVWAGINYDPKNWPEQLFISFPVNSKNPAFTDSMAIMALMNFEEVAAWENTQNTVANPTERPLSYNQFKQEKEEKILRKIEELYPDIREKIQSIHSSTPLTFRDYTGSPRGTMYGIMKDANNPLTSMIGTKTHISNLFLTGQNVFMHGILGTLLGALATTANFIDLACLLQKIRNS